MAYWWVGEAQVIGVILILLINSLLLALIFWLVSKSRESLKIAILFPFLIIWLGFEYFATWWDLAWPWLNLGNAFASSPKWIQWYEITGTRGGSLWLILINYSIFKIYLTKNRIPYQKILFLLALIAFPLLWSVNRMNKKTEYINSKSFALVQPNLDPYTEKFVADKEEKQFANFLKTADSICEEQQPDYLFGPETIILESIDEENPKQSSDYQQLLYLKKKYPNTIILLGVHSHIGSKSFNSALFIADSIAPYFYHKTKLVPLFERVPFASYLRFLKKYSIEIGGYRGTYSNENEIDYFSSKNVAITPVVCFESLFGDYCAQRVPQLPGFLCMITNDGWWKSTQGYQYHFNYSRIRAIESRREYIRVANNGISAHIDEKGTIIAKTNWWKKTVLSGKINLIEENSFYSIHGDYIGRVCLFIACLLLIFVKIRATTHPKPKR